MCKYTRARVCVCARLCALCACMCVCVRVGRGDVLRCPETLVPVYSLHAKNGKNLIGESETYWYMRGMSVNSFRQTTHQHTVALKVIKYLKLKSGVNVQ